MELLPFIFIGAFVVVFIIAAIFGSKAAKKRTLQLEEFAESRGYSFDATQSQGFPSGMALFTVFNTGFGRSMYNTIRGTLSERGMSVEFVSGDYTYKTESNNGKNRSTTTHNRSYVMMMIPLRITQSLSVRKEGLFDKLTALIGFEDINFESAEFSRRFSVNSSDKKFAYAMLDARMMQFMLDVDPPNFELKTGVLLVCEGRWPVEKFATQIDWVRSFIQKWPEHLIRELAIEDA
jgi:hypothetical protein